MHVRAVAHWAVWQARMAMRRWYARMNRRVAQEKQYLGFQSWKTRFSKKNALCVWRRFNRLKKVMDSFVIFFACIKCKHKDGFFAPLDPFFNIKFSLIDSKKRCKQKETETI